MLAYLNPYCLTKFYVLNDYFLVKFYEIESLESYPRLEFDQVYPDDLHYDIYKKIKNLKGKVNLKDVPAAISVTDKEVTDFNHGKSFKLYNPLEEASELYTEMAKLDIFNEESLMRFVARYGLPLDYYFRRPKDIQEEESDEEINNNILFGYMDLLLFYEELAKYKKIFNIWKSIRTDNKSELYAIRDEFRSSAHKSLTIAKKNFFEEYFENSEYAEEYYNLEDEEAEKYENLISYVEKHAPKEELDNIKFEHSMWELWQKNKDVPLIENAKQYLIILINNQNMGKPSFHLKTGDIVPAIAFNNLIEVAYYQLSRAMTNNTDLRACEKCGAFFEVTHGSRKYCPPLLGTKRSTCENSNSQKAKRKRKRKKERE
ncbi:hypothetical protein H7K05_10430 [Priestia aryabhattai]|uniref:DUF6076 domain-containing protein n=1 Tax=Priestia aryabhattai TaxID=412384 RepID=UPI001C8D823C|nr:DUF6076 domain-containing protein [Priestia aryabhattai]MBY0005741.1 hypothetical protein [Priestia aryabhattai]MBY0047578.1 hypothetical protein [Priestia aryabhattai]